jgi:hypothetical protein
MHHDAQGERDQADGKGRERMGNDIVNANGMRARSSAVNPNLVALQFSRAMNPT